MLVSVIMPVFNGMRYLKRSVDSILEQSHTDLEFIIIDDKSTEDVWDFLNSYDDPRLILRQNKENIGLTKSLNMCLDIAKGDLIARQDADDISRPKRIEKEVEAFKDSPNVGLVSCWGQSIDKKNNHVPDGDLEHKIRKGDDDFIKERIVNHNQFYILGPSAMYSMAVVDKIGYYDEELYFSQDRNYWIRILQFFDLRVVREELYLYRRHQGSVRHVKKEIYNGLLGKDRKKMILQKSHEVPIIKTRSQYEWESQT